MDSSDVKQAGRQAKNQAEKVANHPWFEKLARAGYVMSGLVHAMIGWICIRLATGSGGESADQSGALSEFASAPAGAILLGIGAVAMFALALFHVAEIVFGSVRREDGTDKMKEIGKAVGKAGVYAALGMTAMTFALGGSKDSGDDAQSATSSFMGNPFGRFLIIAVGLVIIAIGIYHVYSGITKKFLENLNPSGDAKIGRGIEVTGQAGYIAKGIALTGVGALVAWASITTDTDKARGMDAAFKEILALPAGGIILIAIGIGFMLYGVFCVLRAKYQQM